MLKRFLPIMFLFKIKVVSVSDEDAFYMQHVHSTTVAC